MTVAHTQLIKAMLDGTRGTVVLGGGADVEKRYIAPTVVRDVPVEDSLLGECVVGSSFSHPDTLAPIPERPSVEAGFGFAGSGVGCWVLGDA